MDKPHTHHRPTSFRHQVRLFVLFIILDTLCHGLQPQPPQHHRSPPASIGTIGNEQQPQRTASPSSAVQMDDASALQMTANSYQMDPSTSSSRRKLIQSATAYVSMAAFSGMVFSHSSSAALARNLPLSNGADTSKTGSVDALKPIVLLRYSLSDLKLQMKNKQTLNLEGMPLTEEHFKRIFDAYSDPVSYKQKFMDQNAFLVYYTKGFDGPGRPNIEDDNSFEKQTLQFGARNEAWINWENFLVELKFVGEEDDQDNQAVKYLDDTLRCVDSYIKLAPAGDVKEAQKAVDRYW